MSKAEDLAWLELQQVTAQLWHELSRRLEAEAGMSAAEHEVLWALANSKDRRLTMTDLAGRLWMSRSGMTRLIDRLDKSGWVTRETTPENRRLTYAALTPEGVEAVRASLRVVTTVRPAIFDNRLTSADITDLRRVLGKLQRRLDLLD